MVETIERKRARKNFPFGYNLQGEGDKNLLFFHFYDEKNNLQVGELRYDSDKKIEFGFSGFYPIPVSYGGLKGDKEFMKITEEINKHTSEKESP